MAFQIGGTTVINNSRVASSMTGIPDLAHAETAWNNQDYTFGSPLGSYSAGEVNFNDQGIQPNNDVNWDNLFIDITSTALGGGGNTYGSDVTIRLDGTSGSTDEWTIIPSSHAWTISSRVIIQMQKADNGMLIRTWLTPSNYNPPDVNYPRELNLTDTRWTTTDDIFDNTSSSFRSIVVDWPSWGGGTNNTVNHEIFWR